MADLQAYIPPSDFQTGVDIQVVGNKLIIKPKEDIKFNMNYLLVLDQSIKSVTGAALAETKVITYSSEYRPLYATPSELRPILRGLFSYFAMKDIYVALRDAGQKAHQLQGLVPDANNSRYRPVQERADEYFATTKYVVYEAAKTLLSSLLVNFLNQQGIGSPTDSLVSSGEVELGDFRVKEASSSSTGTSEVKGESPIVIIRASLDDVTAQLKFWQDAMLGRNKRGYSTPKSASTRANAGSPEDRSF